MSNEAGINGYISPDPFLGLATQCDACTTLSILHCGALTDRTGGRRNGLGENGRIFLFVIVAAVGRTRVCRPSLFPLPPPPAYLLPSYHLRLSFSLSLAIQSASAIEQNAHFEFVSVDPKENSEHRGNFAPSPISSRPLLLVSSDVAKGAKWTACCCRRYYPCNSPFVALTHSVCRRECCVHVAQKEPLAAVGEQSLNAFGVDLTFATCATTTFPLWPSCINSRFCFSESRTVYPLSWPCRVLPFLTEVSKCVPNLPQRQQLGS